MSHTDVAAIHLGCTAEIIESMEAAAVARGAMVIRVDMADVADTEGLLHVLAREFVFPDDTEIDGAIDYLSDLSWLGSADGYLVVVLGLSTLLEEARETFELFVRMLPSVVDRCRTAGTPYLVALAGVGEAAAYAQEIVAAKNRSLVEAQERYPWLHDVKAAPVVFHGR